MKITRLNIPFLMVVVSACVAFATQVQDLFPPAKNAPTRSIYLVNQGWHAGIILKRADIPDGVWPEHKDFPDSEYLEVGWGDRDYYQDSDPHFGITLKAALWPTESVLHIAIFNGSVTGYFTNREIVKIELSDELLQSGDKGAIEDLLLLALRDGVTKASKLAEEKMGKVTGGVNLPGLF